MSILHIYIAAKYFTTIPKQFWLPVYFVFTVVQIDNLKTKVQHIFLKSPILISLLQFDNYFFPGMQI